MQLVTKPMLLYRTIVNDLQCTCSDYTITTCLDALSGHTAQGHHWMVAGVQSASPDQPVHTPLCGDSPR